MTILIPALNGARFVARALASVMNQSRDDWNVQLLIDSATVDNTYRKAKQVLAKSKRHKSVHVNVSQKPGLPNVYKELIDRAEPRDDVCGFLDVDDQLEPQAVARIMACYESKPVLGHVWTQFTLSPSGGRGWSRPLPANTGIRDAFARGWWGAQHWRTFRKSVYEGSPYKIQTDVPYATDYNLALVLAATDCRTFHLNKQLYVYHKTVGGITQSKLTHQRACFQKMLVRFKQWVHRGTVCESSSHRSTG